MPADPVPRRGEVWLVSFDPSVGGEIQKTRPAVVVSNDTANSFSSQTSRLYPAEAEITLDGQPRKAMADQITTASKHRLRRSLGELTPGDMNAVDSAIRIQLGL